MERIVNYRKSKKLQSFLLLLVLVLGCVPGCSKGGENPEPAGLSTPTQKPEATATPMPTPTEGPAEVRSLNGMQIIIGDTYSPEVTPAPTNTQEQMLQRFRDEAMQTYDFTIRPQKVADWEELEEVYITSVEAGEPAAQVFELDYRFLAKPLSQGLFYDLATLEELDFENSFWNDSVREVMTKGDSIYGMRPARVEPGGGILWNKRLFEEAGLDPNLPYDLQESGEWTWSRFEEICAALTRDTDEDGQTDVYATGSDGADTLQCLVSSTGEDFIAVDEDGMIYNNCKDESVLGALEFAAKLYEKGYEMPAGEESDWYISAFQTGKAAMQFGEEALCKPDAPYGENCMADAVGFVLPPKPDGQEEYHSYVYGNVWVIPSCYDAETAADIALAFQLYTVNTEVRAVTETYTSPYDYEDYRRDFYRDGEYDERVCMETLPRYNDGETANFLTSCLVDGLNICDLAKNYPFVERTPEECVEVLWSPWQELIDASNEDDEKTDERIKEDKTGLTEAEVKALLKQDLSDAFLYELAVSEADESYTYALFVKNRSEKESVPNIISFDQSVTGILLVAVENETGTLHYLFEGTAKDYLKQACLMRVDEEVYFLLNRQMNYIEWERGSLDTFVLEGSGMRQVYGFTEGDNLYDYWFSHKAELCADGTIELSKREDSLASYNEYIHTFSQTATDVLTYEAGSSWEPEHTEDLDEFLRKQMWKEHSELPFESWSEVDVLLQMRQSELFFNEEIDIEYSQCAVLQKKDMGRFCLLVVKAKNDHHQAGFQNLIFTLYDKENSEFITAKGCHGDFSDAYLFEADNEEYIAYYTQTVYTGIPTADGGVLKLAEDDFVKLWPAEEDGASVFDGKVAELTEDGRFLFSEVKWNTNEEGMILDYELIPGEQVSVFDIIAAE